MTKDISIIIENKLVMEKRDMNVYHHFSRSAHMISYNSSITLPLKPAFEDDYVHISVVSGPGHLENKTLLNLPAWVDFEFSSLGNVTIIHSGDRTVLKIPPGPPVWQLKMTRSSATVAQQNDRVTIGDDRLEFQ